MTRGVALVLGCALAGTLAASCSDTPSAPPAPSAAPGFPADYASSYTLLRGCRKSGDHELDFIRVLVDPTGVQAYTDRTTPFPDGAVVLKEQYDVSDTACTGPLVAWTVMVKDSAATERLGWDWQRVTPDRRVVEANTTRCFGCHTACSGGPAGGYDSTCTEP